MPKDVVPQITFNLKDFGQKCNDCSLEPLLNKSNYPIVEENYAATLDIPTTLIIGIAPGGVENARKRPFIGPAGYRLRKMLNEIVGESWSKNIVLSNLLMCRIPQNKEPLPQDILSCKPHLEYLFAKYPNLKAVVLAGRVVQKQAKVVYKEQLKSIAHVIDLPHPAFELHSKDRAVPKDRTVRAIWELNLTRLKDAKIL